MPSLPALYILQWLTIGIYIVLYFIIGMFRGAQKSLYFTIVNVITTIVVIALISQLSIRFVFNFVELDTLIDMVNGYTSNSLSNVEPYLNDPAVQSTIFIFIDLVLRIIGFFVLYPILKRILTFIIFRPIWSFGIKKAIIKKQNEQAEEKAIQKNKKFKPRKRMKKSAINRFVGGVFGSINGMIVAFVILIPITVSATYVSNIDTTQLSAIESQNQNLALNAPGVSGSTLDEIIKYLEQTQELNEKGLSSITKYMTINQVPIDQYIFDEVFTVEAEFDDETVDVNFIRELENIFGISSVVINGGYLDENFDYTQIDQSDLENIELIFDYIGNSDVLSYLIPVATKYGVENILTDEIGINLYERTASKEALDMFIDIDWDSEMDRLYALVASVLTFGSVEEIMDYANNPETLATLTPEEGVALAQIFRSVGDLEVLSLINVGIDYLTTLEEAQNQIQWLDTETEKEDYLQESLAFILDEPDFFIGEDGEISEIANLIELMFTDTYGNTNLDIIVDSGGDPKVILEQQNATWVSAVIDQLTQLELLMEALPIAADFALYEIGGDQIDQQIADDLELVLDDVQWDSEFENFDNIYQNVVALGLEQILVDQPDYIAYLDVVVNQNMDNVRDIVEHIFEDSQLVGSALDIIAPLIIENYISDQELKEIVENIVLDDEDEFDFNVGSEIVSLLNIVEYTFDFTNATELSQITTSNQEQLLSILASFGAMNQTSYTAYLDAFNDLQLLNRIDETVAQQLVEKFDLEDSIYIPSDFALNEDVTAIIDMIHDVGIYYHDAHVSNLDYKYIDITDLLDDLSDHLLDSEKRSQLLFYNMAYYAKKYADDPNLSSYLKVPDDLKAADVESTVWDTEINQLVGSIFDFVEVIGETKDITLSVNDILLYSREAYRLPIEILTQFADESISQNAFSALDSSRIFRASLTQVIDTQGKSLSSSLYGYEIQTPAHLLTNGEINAGILVDFMHGVGVFANGLNQTLNFETIGEFKFDDLTPYFEAFNAMESSEIQALVESDLLHGIISDMLLDGSFQTEIVNVLNNAQSIAVLPSDFLDVDDDLIDNGVLVDGEITSLFVMIQSLSLTSTQDLSGIGLDTFTNLVVEDPQTGEDKFDEFFGSNYIYTLLDKMLRLDSLNTYINTMLGDAIGGDFQTLDLTIPNEMLGQSADVGTSIEPIEEGRIPRAEFRRMLVSLNQVGPLSDLGIQTFTDMIDPGNSEDNFSVFIESDFIYLVLSRLIGHQGFETYAEDALSGSFGNDPVSLDMSVPNDALGSVGIENGYLSRTELRNLMVSFKMLGFDGNTSPDVATIIAMPNQNTYSATQDDLDIFLNSIYLRDKMSQMLLSDTIINLIGAGQFTANEFDLPTNAYDAQLRLSQDQIHKVFDSLVLLNITDFNQMNIGLDSVTNLTEAEQTQLLDAIYLYEVMDLMIKAQQPSLSIPNDALEQSGYYNQMITKTEILALLSVFEIPEIGSDPTQINTNSITTTVLKEILDKGSLIIQQMISDQVEIALSINQNDIVDAYEVTPSVDRILLEELKAIIEVMEVIGMTDLSSSFSVNQISVSQLQNVHYLGLGSDPVDDLYDSYIIHDLVVSQIEETLTVEENTHPDAYTTSPLGQTIMFADEVQALIEVMSITGMVDLSAGFDVSSVSLSNLQEIHYLGLGSDPVDDLYDSYIIHDLIDTQVETALQISMVSLPEAYFETANQIDMIKADEIQALIEAMDEMGVADLSASFDVDAIGLTELQNVHYLGLGSDPVDDLYDSYIVHQMISDAMISSIDIPTDAYMANGHMKALEVQGVIDALMLLSSNPATDTLNTIMPVANNTFTPTLITSLLDIQSLTIYRLVANGIKSSGIATLESYAELGDLNYDANDVNEDIKIDEMYGLAEAMTLLGVSDVTQASNINMASVLALSDTDVDTILDNSNTITYFIIDDVVDPNDNLFGADYVNDEALNLRVIRTTLINYIKSAN